MYFCIEKTLNSQLVSGTDDDEDDEGLYFFTRYSISWSNAWLLSYEQTKTQVSLYVNSTEKWTGMKNTRLKMPEEDQIYV